MWFTHDSNHHSPTEKNQMKILDDTYLQHKKNIYLKKCNIKIIFYLNNKIILQ